MESIIIIIIIIIITSKLFGDSCCGSDVDAAEAVVFFKWNL